MTAFGGGIDLGWTLFAIVGAMAVVLVLVINRLERMHPREWTQMGKPAVLKFWGDYKARWALFKYMFTEAHVSLNDRGLSALIWTMRGLIAAGVIVGLMQWTGSPSPPR